MNSAIQEWMKTTLGYAFEREAYLVQALTHPSFDPERSDDHYERLEFLGDSVLGLMISEALYAHYKNEAEGPLAKRRAALVCREHLAKVGRDLKLGDVMKLGNSEVSASGHENDGILENIVESLIAALYLDGGYETVKRVAYPWFERAIKTMGEPPRDPKTSLQEWAQGQGFGLPIYETISREGPSHAPEFTVKVSLNKKSASGTGASKKIAQREAAASLIKALKIE